MVFNDSSCNPELIYLLFQEQLMHSDTQYNTIPEVDPFLERDSRGSRDISSTDANYRPPSSKNFNSLSYPEEIQSHSDIESSENSGTPHQTLDFYTSTGWKKNYHIFPADIRLAKVNARKNLIVNPYRPSRISMFSSIEALKEISPIYGNYFNFIKDVLKLIVILFGLTSVLNFIVLFFMPGVYPSVNEITELWFDFSVLAEVQKREPFWIKAGINLSCILLVRLLAPQQQFFTITTAPKAKILERDYAVLIENLPVDTAQDDLAAFLNEKLKGHGIPGTVKGILKIDDLSELLLEVQKLRILQLKYLKNPDSNPDLPAQIAKLQQEITRLSKINTTAANKKTDKALVVFERTQARAFFIREYQTSLLRSFWRKIRFDYNLGADGIREKTLIFKSNLLLIKECPLPDDINWENLSCPYGQRVKRKIISAGLSCIINAFIGVLTYFLQLIMNQNYITFLNEIIYICCIIALLYVSDLWSKYIVSYQKIDGASTARLVELHWKFWAHSIIIIVGFLTNFGSPHPEIYSSRLLWTLIIFSLIPPLHRFLFVSYEYTRRVVLRRRYRDFDKVMITQEEAGQIFSNPEFNCLSGALNISHYFFIAFSLNNFLPIASLLCIIAIALNYAVDKFNIIYRHPKIKEPDPRLGINFNFLLEFDISLQLLSLFVYWYIVKSPNNQQLQSLGAGSFMVLILLLFLAHAVKFVVYPNTIEDPKFTPKYITNQNYDAVKMKFKKTYLRSYPLKSKYMF